MAKHVLACKPNLPNNQSKKKKTLSEEEAVDIASLRAAWIPGMRYIIAHTIPMKQEGRFQGSGAPFDSPKKLADIIRRGFKLIGRSSVMASMTAGMITNGSVTIGRRFSENSAVGATVFGLRSRPGDYFDERDIELAYVNGVAMGFELSTMRLNVFRVVTRSKWFPAPANRRTDDQVRTH
ncbi:hypothetical protein LTR81_000205 [Elasticomyces elasticus]